MQEDDTSTYGNEPAEHQDPTPVASGREVSIEQMLSYNF